MSSLSPHLSVSTPGRTDSGSLGCEREVLEGQSGFPITVLCEVKSLYSRREKRNRENREVYGRPEKGCVKKWRLVGSLCVSRFFVLYLWVFPRSYKVPRSEGLGRGFVRTQQGR